MKANKHGLYDQLATHRLAHLDEMGGMAFLLDFGRPIYPGIHKASLEFLAEAPKAPRPGTVYVGIGELRLGEFDEHRLNGPRLQNQCATKLVASRLGILSKHGVNELVGEILWCDTRPKVFPSQLANLVKAAHRTKITSNQLGTFRWTHDAIRAIISSDPFDEKYDIRRSWQNFRQDRGIAEIKSLEEFFSTAHGRRKSFVTELAGICARMRSGLRQKWLPTAFEMIIKDAELLQQAIEEVNANAKTVDVQTDGASKMMMLITSDNEQLLRAASSSKTGKADISVVRNSLGHTAIVCNSEQGIDLKNLAVMIRMAEYRKRTGQKLSVKKASGEGAVDACPQWYLANENLLLNGSPTHPSVKPSKLTLDEIENIASRAFMATQREAWFLNYHEGPKAFSLPASDAVHLVLD